MFRITVNQLNGVILCAVANEVVPHVDVQLYLVRFWVMWLFTIVIRVWLSSYTGIGKWTLIPMTVGICQHHHSSFKPCVRDTYSACGVDVKTCCICLCRMLMGSFC